MPEVNNPDAEHASSSEEDASESTSFRAGSRPGDTGASLSDIESIVSDRNTFILEGIASDMKRATPPLNHTFLVENQVTADECFDTSKFAGQIIDGFLKAPAKVQLQILACGALSGDEEGIDSKVLSAMIDQVETRKDVMRRLHSLNDEE